MTSNVVAFPKTPQILTEIVKKAIIWTVVDDGRLTRMQRLELERAVSARLLTKGRGGPFPMLVDVYAAPGCDFAEERKAEIAFQGYLTLVTRRAA